MPLTQSRHVCSIACALCVVLLSTSSTAGQAIGDEPARVAALTAGRDTFLQFCAPCHGVDGTGRGPVAAVLSTTPPNLTQVTRRSNGKFPLDTLEQMLTLATRLPTPAHGSEQMPIWGGVFRSIDSTPTLVRARIANLLAYLESIQR